MPKTIDQIFTHISDLKQDPEYLRPVEPVLTAALDPNRPTVMKTPVGLLEESCRKIYEKPPDYKDDFKTIDGKPHFEVVCTIMDKKTFGAGKTKKAAKHQAASNMLRVLVKKTLSYAKQMGIPHGSEEEALKYIDSLSAELSEGKVAADVDAEFDTQKNYIGAVQQLCQKEKLDNPIYETSEEGPPNNMTFTCICIVGALKAEAKGKTKKIAKSLAACKMLDLLQKGIAEMKEDLFLDEGYSVAADEIELELEKKQRIHEINDPISELEQILHSENIQLKALEYRILEQKCSIGMRQCLLKVIWSGNGEVERTDVYPGAGNTELEAKQECARLALLHFGTF